MMPSKQQSRGEASADRPSPKPATGRDIPSERHTGPAGLMRRVELGAGPFAPRDVLQLQATIGNQAVGRLLTERIQRQDALDHENTVVQRMQLYRFGTRGAQQTFRPRNPVPAKMTLENFCRAMLEKAGYPVEAMEFEGVAANEQATLLAAEMHAQNSLGENNALSPFLSLATSWGDAATAGTIREIVENAESIFTFDIPDERVVKVGNGVSYGESEILVWLRQGESIQESITDEMMNIYRKGNQLEDRFEPGETMAGTI